MSYILLVLSALFRTTVAAHNGTFPPVFKFGVATSAFQIEGGWNASDKGESMWDRFTHENIDSAIDHSNAEIASDSYHQWRQDVQIVHDLGLDFYRFSISWSRLLPTGFSNVVSKDGTNYYNQLINGLLERNVTPLITLYHWDLPQRLQNLGGWTNPLVADWFAEYADVVFRLYGDRVKTWITINEPNLMCDMNYNTGLLAPGIKDPDTATYLCNKHVLVAHAKAWRLYQKKYKAKWNGLLAIAHQVVWIEALQPADEEIAELAREFSIGRYAHPIHSKEGGWPPILEKRFSEYSKKKGYVTSRLPPFTKEEKLLVRGTYDFFAINYYSSRLARAARPGDKPAVFFDTGIPELDIALVTDPHWPIAGHSFIPSYPKGLRRLIQWMRKSYGEMEFFITENGYANSNSDLNDYDRIEYFKQHLEQVLHSIHYDGANVTGYTAWTLMDNYEWSSGYTLNFGLHHVDFSDPMRKRTPKASAYFYADVIKRRSLNVPIQKLPSLPAHKSGQNGIVSADFGCHIIALLSILFAATRILS